MPATAPRYAVYWAPDRDSDLDRFGRAWLGRNAATGEEVAPPAVPGIAAERQRAITAEPRRYGFHGTLKPPFALAAGRAPDALHEAVARFAAERSAFSAPPLALRRLGGFLALVPSRPCPKLDRLAADAVRAFDRFRAPPPAAELERRRRAGLSPRQELYLQEWGYPYVMEEFRFHLTLTGRLEAAEGAAVMAALAPLVGPLCAAPVPVCAVCVFEQALPDAPFLLARRFPFGR